MPWRTNLIYVYDATFDGFLSCVFESFSCRELPVHILPQEDCEASLYPIKWVDTDPEKARRVLDSIPRRISAQARQLVIDSFYTCLPDKERHILNFLRLGYQVGKTVTNRITDDRVMVLQKAVQHLGNEAHLFKGFLRFSVYGNVMVGVIEPKNFVLPMIAEHFCSRYQNEAFLIYDKTHRQALVHRPYEAVIVDLERLELPQEGAEEIRFQQLWKRFYDTVGIEGRYNPRCRMTHMPKRYWSNMLEMKDTLSADQKENRPSAAALTARPA